MVKNLPAMQKTQVLIPGSGRSPGEGHGNPLQPSCLENPTDRRAWWTTVHGVTKSRIWQKQPSTHTHVRRHVIALGLPSWPRPLKSLNPICYSASFHSSLQSEWIIRTFLQSLREMGTSGIHWQTSFYCTSNTGLFFFLNKLKVCGNSESSKSISIISPTAFAHFVSLCHILVTFPLFHNVFIIIVLAMVICG